MRLCLFIGLAFALIFIAACQGPPPTVIYVVFTPTPDDGTASANTQAVTQAITQSPTPTPTPTVTPPGPFPTDTISQIQVAEQIFEHGRMYWLQPTDQIWVLVVEEEGHGTWRVYNDTFEEGDPESDPSIVAPADLLQPMRGFGKLWRQTPEVREALGWAVTPEFGYVSNYEYHPGGEVVNGEYVRGPGYHVLFSLYDEAFRFNEADGTWQLGG